MSDGHYDRIEARLQLSQPASAALTNDLADAVLQWVGAGWILVDSDALAVHDDAIRVSYVPGSPAGAAAMAEWLRDCAARHDDCVTGVQTAAGRDFWLARQRRCECAIPREYLITSTGFVNTPPLRCTTCGGDVPLTERVPRQVLDPLLNWHRQFTHLHELWLDAEGSYCRWARAELEFVDSLLNLTGREVAAHLSSVTGCPTYYELFVQLYEEGAEGGLDTRQHCPGCWRPWTRGTERLGPELWCEACFLARYEPVLPETDLAGGPAEEAKAAADAQLDAAIDAELEAGRSGDA
ncbi:MAG: DUF2310 family Zn-ribbon-containing protein [Planctomycetota bacterium]